MTLHLLGAFLATLLSVGLKANQNLSVLYRRYSLLAPTSLCLAIIDFYVINLLVTSSAWIILATGLGGALGCYLSIKFDQYWKRTHD